MAKRETSPVASVRMPRGNALDGRADYINAMFDASDRARTAQLEAAYSKAASDMAAARVAADKHYDAAENAYIGHANVGADAVRTFAAPRGMNTGAGSQAAMAMSNQGIIDANAIAAARAQTEKGIDRQREALDQNYAAQRKQLLAQSAQGRNNALYRDAIMADEARRQQTQFVQSQNQTAFQNELAAQQKYLKALAKANKGKGTGGDLGSPIEDPKAVEPIDPYALYNLTKDTLINNLQPHERYRAKMVLDPIGFATESRIVGGYGNKSYPEYLDGVLRTAGLNPDKLFPEEEEDTAVRTGGGYDFT